MMNHNNVLKSFYSYIGTIAIIPIKALYLYIFNPSIVFVLTLTIILLTNPIGDGIPFDRIAFLFLGWSVLSFTLINFKRIALYNSIFIPMACLLAISIIPIFYNHYTNQTWSVIGNKYLVPFSLFFFSKVAFRDESSLQIFLIFLAVVTMYLTLTSIAFFLDFKAFIFPKYILDPTIGDPNHFLRARGPFLNAVPNGIAVMMCGFTSMLWFQKKHYYFLFWIFIATVPIAILATMTRGVWLSFGISAIILIVKKNKVTSKIGFIFLLYIAISTSTILLSNTKTEFIQQRLYNYQNIEFRKNLLFAGFEMFKNNPLFGIGTNQIPKQIPLYLENYKDDVWVHNTYLEILIEHGLIGLFFYTLIIIKLFKVDRQLKDSANKSIHFFSSPEYALLWRIFLIIYLINGIFVVLNYQFINALLYSIAGIKSGIESEKIS
jgi:O-antigen ligase